MPIGAASLFAPAEAYATDEPAGSRAENVVTRYFGILNAGMASTNAEFSALASVYANKTVLTQTSPLGVTHVFEGLDAVTGFYVAAWQYFHGITRAQDHIRNLASTGVLSYEHAGRPRQAKPGLCAPHSRCAVAASAASTGLPTRGVFRDRQMSQEGNDNHQNGPTEQCRDMALPTPRWPCVLPAPVGSACHGQASFYRSLWVWDCCRFFVS